MMSARTENTINPGVISIVISYFPVVFLLLGRRREPPGLRPVPEQRPAAGRAIRDPDAG